MISQSIEHPPETTSEALDLGRRAARNTQVLPQTGRVATRLSLRRDRVAAIVSHGSRSREDERIIRTAARETRDMGRSLRRHPIVRDTSGEEMPRACAVARDYLAAVQDTFSEP